MQFVRLSCAVLAACTLVACEDAVSPDARTPVPKAFFSTSGSDGSLSMPTQAFTTYFSGSLGPYSSPTVIQLDITGTIEAFQHGADSSGNWVIGQHWTSIDFRGVLVGSTRCHAPVIIWWGGNKYGSGRCVAEDTPPLIHSVTALVNGTGEVTRSSLYSAQSTSCNGAPCKYHTGGHNLSWSRKPAELELRPTQVLIEPGQSASFTATVEPDSIGRFKTPFSGLTWNWHPDGGTQAQICGSSTTCPPPAGVNGTLTASATVNGLVKTKDARVEVKTDQITLSANESTVKPGEAVTFTAATQNGTAFTVQGWQWHSASGAPGLTRSGAACGQAKTCTIRVYEDGHMQVTGAVQGTTIPQQAIAPVSVVTQCPSGDPVLDTDHIRDSLVAMLNGSGYPGLQPGQRTERQGYILQHRVSGELSFVSNYDPNATACTGDIAVDYDSIEYILVAIVHTHPYHLLEAYPPCANYPAGRYNPLPSPPDLSTLQHFINQLQQQNEPPPSAYFIDGNLVVQYDAAGNQQNTQYVGGQCPWSQQP